MAKTHYPNIGEIIEQYREIFDIKNRIWKESLEFAAVQDEKWEKHLFLISQI